MNEIQKLNAQAREQVLRLIIEYGYVVEDPNSNPNYIVVNFEKLRRKLNVEPFPYTIKAKEPTRK